MRSAPRLLLARFVVPAIVGMLALELRGTAARQDQAAGEPEAVSLLGTPLYRTPAEGDALAKLESGLKDAAKKCEAEPENSEAILAYGRALASLWRYREAVDVYTRGIAAHPGQAALYRHRGHRRITLRQFDQAVADLTRAAGLDAGDFDIWYHLGLAHYLRGEFARAEAAYLECRKAAGDDGSLIAASNWLYITLRRQGKKTAAAAVLDGIKENMDAGENAAYHSLLLFYKGLKEDVELEAAAAASDLDLATTGYGLACWHLYNGDPGKAYDGFRKIVGTRYWPAFGYIAAEAELHRAGR